MASRSKGNSRMGKLRSPRQSQLLFGLRILTLIFLTGCTLLTPADVKRGDRFLQEGNWEEAVLAYKRALKDDPFNQSLINKFSLARERAAVAHQERGRALLKEQQTDLALDEYKRALSMEPTSVEHQTGFAEALRHKEARDLTRESDRLVQVGRVDEALENYARAAGLDPTLTEALEGITRLTEEQEAQKRDQGGRQPVTLRFRSAGLKEVLEGLAKTGGTNVVFDKDVRNDPINIAVQDTPFEDALNLILSSNNLFSRRVGPETLLISPNTKQKQEQYQDQMIRTFYLSNMKAKDMLVLLKSMLDSKRVHANEQLNTIVIRDQPEKVQLAEKIILANDRQDSEVLFDVEVLEVDRTVNQTYGLTYPKQVAAAIVPPGFAGAIAGDVAQQFTLSQLTSLGKDSYLFKLPTNIQLDFFKQITDAKTLAAPRVRVVNNKKAEINIGDKQPILLSTTNVLPGQAATGAVPTTSTVTSIEFRDTGVKLTVEPSIRLANELALKMKIEVIRLGEQVVLQASPPITQFKFGNRSAETMLSVKDGETVVLGGLLQEEDRRTRVTIPWLGDLPVIGNLISSFRTEKVTTEVILTITPHIVQAMTPPGLETQAFWSGTESLYATTPVFSDPVRRISTSSADRSSKLPLSATAQNGTHRRSTETALLRPDELPRLSFKPTELAVAPGQELTLDLTAQHLRMLNEGTIKIEYDPQVLDFRKAMAGEFLKQGAPQASVTAAPDLKDGSVELKMRRAGKPLTGSGKLISLTFAAKIPGVTALHVGMPEAFSQGQPTEAPEGGSGIVRVR
ncbi:MAG: secretin N-terminal domain-containing protein [Nitrospiraceae bacterium]